MRLDHFLLSPRVSDRLVDGWCRAMGAWAGKRQRPCANMDNARSLDQSCVNQEFIENKALETRGARVLSRIFAKTRQAPGRNCHQERRAICSSGRITSYADII
jgi:hypothetical protein